VQPSPNQAAPARIEALRSGRVTTALVMLAIFVTMSIMALGFPERARLMPLLVGMPGSLLALILVFVEWRAQSQEAASSDVQFREAHRNEKQMFFWMMLFFVGILCFGFAYAAPPLVLAMLRFGKKESLAVAAGGAIGTWAVLYGLFELTFQIPLFDGHVVEWLRG
jgi:hypothetical protein